MKRIASIVAVAIVALGASALPALADFYYFPYPYRWDDPRAYDDNPAPFRNWRVPYYAVPWQRGERRSFYARDRFYHYYIDVERVPRYRNRYYY